MRGQTEPCRSDRPEGTENRHYYAEKAADQNIPPYQRIAPVTGQQAAPGYYQLWPSPTCKRFKGKIQDPGPCGKQQGARDPVYGVSHLSHSSDVVSSHDPVNSFQEKND